MKWKIDDLAVAVPSTSTVLRPMTVTAGGKTYNLFCHQPSGTVVITDEATGLEQMVSITEFTPDPNPRWGTLKPLLAGTMLGEDFSFAGELHLDAPGQDHRRVMAKNAVKQVDSPMTGKVIKVLCEDGAEVTEKTAVVVVEAMKMEHQLRAPFDAVVESLDCAEGEQVDLGQVLARLERRES